MCVCMGCVFIYVCGSSIEDRWVVTEDYPGADSVCLSIEYEVCVCDACRVVSCRVVSCCVVLCRGVACRVVLCCVVS